MKKTKDRNILSLIAVTLLMWFFAAGVSSFRDPSLYEGVDGWEGYQGFGFILICCFPILLISIFTTVATFFINLVNKREDRLNNKALLTFMALHAAVYLAVLIYFIVTI